MIGVDCQSDGGDGRVGEEGCCVSVMWIIAWKTNRESEIASFTASSSMVQSMRIWEQFGGKHILTRLSSI
jgi:hypothetical protein